MKRNLSAKKLHQRRAKRTIVRLVFWKTPLAWLQLTYQKSRFLMASLGIASAIVLMFVQFGFLGALYESNTSLHQNLRGDLILLHARTEALVLSEQFSRRLLYQMLSFEGVASVSPVYQSTGSFKNVRDGRSRTISIYGVHSQISPFDFPDLDRQLDRVRFTDTVLFDRNSRPEYGTIEADFEAGKEILVEVNDRRIEIGGVITFTGTSFGVTGNLVTSDVNFLRLFPERGAEQITLGIIALRPGRDPEAVAAKMKRVLPKDVRVLTVSQFIEIEQEYWRKTTAIGFVFSIGALVGFAIGMYIVYQILYSEIADRIPDYALLKARGYRNRYFLSVLFQESIFLSLSSYIPGYLLSVGLYKIVADATRLPIGMTNDRALLVYSLTICMCLASGALVANKLKDSDPADLF